MATKIKTIKDYQLAAARLAVRAKKDRAFRKRLLKDPIKVLKAAGFNPDYTRELIREDAYLRTRFEAEAARLATDWCVTTRCCCTSCCITCLTFTSRLAGGKFGAPDLALEVEPERKELLDRLIESGHIRGPR